MLVYVDENLCTACGICLDACNRGAISLSGTAATIDETLCTSCGRCADVCLTGAIITLEIDSTESVGDTPRDGVAPTPGTVVPTVPDLVPVQAAAPLPGPATRSKLGMMEQVVSGLVGLVTFALDVKRSLSAGPAAGTGEAATTVGGGRGAAPCPRGRQSRVGEHGQGLGGGRGPGGGRGRNNRCGTQRGNRTS